MDNHRAALWCWNDAMDLQQPHSIIHIDRHYDTLGSQIDVWTKNIPDLDNGIEQYLNATYDAGWVTCPVVRWDNYLSIHIAIHESSIRALHLATHRDGDRPAFPNVFEDESWNLPTNDAFWPRSDDGPWIVNIDLDYFYCEALGSGGSEDPQTRYVQMHSDEYVEEVFNRIAESYRDGLVSALTVSLTPTNFTKGWRDTERLASLGLARLGLTFNLP